MRKFKVNELAKLGGITPQTLRRYDKLEIFHPERDKNNSYRLYDTKNLIQLFRLQSLKNYGFSLQEVGGLYKDDVDKAVSAYEKRIRNMEKKLEELEQKKYLAEKQRQRLEDWQRLSTVPFELRKRPECQVFLYRKGHEVYDEAQVMDNLPLIAEHMGLLRSCVIRREEDLIQGKPEYYGGMYAYAEELADAEWSKRLQWTKLPECTCMVIAEGGLGSLEDRDVREGHVSNNMSKLAKIQETVKAHRFRICGDILGEVLHLERRREKGLAYNSNYHNYSLMWIPVKPISDE